MGGDPDLVDAMALRAVPAGLVGARRYHGLTDRRTHATRSFDAAKIWEGGLGIPGGLIAGMVVAVIHLRGQGVDIPRFADAVVPGIALARALAGVRVNIWTSAAAVTVGVIMAVRTHRTGKIPPVDDGESVHRPLGDGSNIAG